jgi:hypothetical protein
MGAMKEEIPESFWEALVEVKDKDINELKTLLKVIDQAKHAALQREGFAVEERDKARELFQTAMELSKKYKDERDECQVEQGRALKAWTEAVSERTAALLERDEYKIGHDRYEKLRLLSPMQYHELYDKNIKTGEHFDTLVDKL